MIQFYEKYNSCDIILDSPITDDDIEMLKVLFNREYNKINITFGIIYTIKRSLTLLLYKEIFHNNKNIRITTHKSKLTKYFHRLGFDAVFISLLKDDLVKTDEIEVILIGGSADSSSKILNVVKNISLDSLSLIIVQHIKPNIKGMFDKILQNYTEYKVSYAKNGERVKKGRIYLASKDRHLEVNKGFFKLTSDAKQNYSRPSISVSYASFSTYYKEKLLIIQECGYAYDGVDKLHMLKDNNSIIVLQDPSECEAISMVESALSLKIHNYVLKEKEIVMYINIIDKHLTQQEWILFLLDEIFNQYNYDFRLYKIDMVTRRVNVFMIKHDINNIRDAIALILFNHSAFKAFFLDLSINVTEFFRNPHSFENIKKFINIVYKNSKHIKIWSAGCSSGKEAYSLAMVLDSIGKLDKSIIYATDFNSVILEDAKAGIYSNTAFDVLKRNLAMSPENNYIENYIVKYDNFMLIKEKIVEKVLFLQHNLATDSSFNEFDIIICKNVIIYFNEDLQNRVFSLIYDSLRFGGYLVLGESETLSLEFLDKFSIVSLKSKIYKKVA